MIQNNIDYISVLRKLDKVSTSEFTDDVGLHVTCWLMSDVRRGPRSAPAAGHDVAGPGLQKDLPDAHVRIAARFRDGDVAPYTGPVKKHAAVGKLASRRAVRPPPRPPLVICSLAHLHSVMPVYCTGI
jgi:hypothetical protein